MVQTICIIEDDEGIQDVLKIILKRAGFEICLFADGHQVMEDHFSLPDLFLIDKQLPGIDGLEICRHLKASRKTRSIPVVMMSAYPNAQQLSRDAGADDFIEKPFQLERLLSTIKKYVPAKAVA